MLKVVELFSGYGSQALALKRLGIDFTSTQCDIDKYAVQAYNQIHGETLNLGDITKVDESKLDKDIDLLTYSSPCFTEDTLVYTENGYASIKDITIGTKVLTHDGTFKPVLNKYDNGLKQTIALKAMGTYGITCTPEHKFYVREKQYQWVDKGRKSKEGWKKKDKIRCFSTPKWKEAKNLSSKDYLGFPINNKAEIPAGDGIVFNWTDGRTQDRGYSANGLSPTLNTCQGGNLEPKIVEPLALDEQNKYIRKDGTVGTLTTDGSSPKHNNRIVEQCYSDGFRIRKFTPRECFRLMGVADEDFNKLHDISKTQLYKLAGNSIVVDVLAAIFRNLLINKTTKDTTIFDFCN